MINKPNISTLLLLLLYLSSNINVTDALCTINDVVGETYYLTVADACWKAQELFQGGTLEADSTDPTCSSSTFTSGGVYSLFDSINKETNLVTFKDGPMGYSGT